MVAWATICAQFARHAQWRRDFVSVATDRSSDHGEGSDLTGARDRRPSGRRGRWAMPLKSGLTELKLAWLRVVPDSDAPPPAGGFDKLIPEPSAMRAMTAAAAAREGRAAHPASRASGAGRGASAAQSPVVTRPALPGQAGKDQTDEECDQDHDQREDHGQITRMALATGRDNRVKHTSIITRRRVMVGSPPCGSVAIAAATNARLPDCLCRRGAGLATAGRGD